MPLIKPRAILQGPGSFHEGNALAFDGIGNQYFGLVIDLLKAGKDILQGRVVVTVAARHVPAEDLEFGFQVPQVYNIFQNFVGLDLVVVDNHDEVVDVLLRGRLQ